MADGTLLEQLVRRDRAVVIGGLVGVILSSWVYLLLGSGLDMGAMQMNGPAMEMAGASWSPAYAGLMLLMWIVMMVAMMLPSAAPMILLFATVNRKRRLQGSPYVRTGIFATGYVVVWAGFSLAAVVLQWGLDRAMLLSPMLATTSTLLSGGVLLAAGLYQLTPLKQACLRNCRSPFDFIVRNWRNGSGGALEMGARHGLYCLGCCWVLMCLLFVGGVMNLVWIAALAAYVLLEKAAPAGHWLGRAGGMALIIWGGAVLASALS